MLDSTLVGMLSPEICQAATYSLSHLTRDVNLRQRFIDKSGPRTLMHAAGK